MRPNTSTVVTSGFNVNTSTFRRCTRVHYYQQIKCTITVGVKLLVGTKLGLSCGYSFIPCYLCPGPVKTKVTVDSFCFCLRYGDPVRNDGLHDEGIVTIFQVHICDRASRSCGVLCGPFVVEQDIVFTRRRQHSVGMILESNQNNQTLQLARILRTSLKVAERLLGDSDQLTVLCFVFMNKSPAERIVVAGFSQGGAMALFVALRITIPQGSELLAWREQVLRDRARLLDTRKRTNVLPLGSAALAGTVYPIDRSDAGLDATHLFFDDSLKLLDRLAPDAQQQAPSFVSAHRMSGSGDGVTTLEGEVVIRPTTSHPDFARYSFGLADEEGIEDMRVPLEGGGRLVVELNATEVKELGDKLIAAVP